jgi:ketosteroid isomerase-like protein
VGTDGPEGAEGDSAQENQELVGRHYAAFASGDIDGVLAGLDPDVCIEVHDEHGKTVGEPMRGLDQARAFFEEIGESVTNTTVEIESLRVDEDRVLARLELGGTIRKTSITGTIPAVHLFTIHEGLITIIRTHRPDWRNFQPDD